MGHLVLKLSLFAAISVFSFQGNTQELSKYDYVLQGDQFYNDRLYQEALWAFNKANHEKNAELAKSKLTTILKSRPYRGEVLGKTPETKGIATTYLLTFEQDVKAVFKIDGTGAGRARYEVAAYLMDQLLGFDMVPMTIQRTFIVAGHARVGSLTYFVKNSKNGQQLGHPDTKDLNSLMPQDIRFFDFLINNRDRHYRNYLIRDNGDHVAIDHNIAFGARAGSYPPRLVYPQSKHLLDRVLELTKKDIKDTLSGTLSKSEVDGVVSRLKRLQRALFIEKILNRNGGNHD